jgi:hypothetical protein
LVFKRAEIPLVLAFSQVIGIGLTGLYVDKVTDGNLRKFDHCQTSIFTGYSQHVTLIIATSIALLISQKFLNASLKIKEKLSF